MMRRSLICVIGVLAVFMTVLRWGEDSRDRLKVLEGNMLRRLDEEERLLDDKTIEREVDAVVGAIDQKHEEVQAKTVPRDPREQALYNSFHKPYLWSKPPAPSVASTPERFGRGMGMNGRGRGRNMERGRGRGQGRGMRGRGRGRRNALQTQVVKPQAGPFIEKYLLLPAVQVGFASGIRTAIIPFLMLAAKANRTAVLPKVQFGIPAFRSTSDPQFLELSDFLDMDDLLKQLPCVRTISYDEWKQKTSATVDAVLQFGLPEEIGPAGMKQAPPRAVADCITLPGTTQRPKNPKQPGPFWAGTFGHSNEIVWLHSTEQLIIHRTVCASFQMTLSATQTFTQVSGEKSIMIYNVPGMVRGPFIAGGGPMKGIVKMFRDIPQVNLCSEGGGASYPSFNTWPKLSPEWQQMGKDFVENVLDEGFTCVQIRGEKLVLRAAAKGNTQAVAALRQNDPYLDQCVDALVKIIQEKRKGKLLLVTDLDMSTGSPSSRRSGNLANWSTNTLQKLKKMFPDSETFCNSKHHTAMKQGESTAARVLKAYSGNCAIAETAICRQSSNIIRFGTGSMGDFVVGTTIGSEETQWYKTCEDVIKGVSIAR